MIAIGAAIAQRQPSLAGLVSAIIGEVSVSASNAEPVPGTDGGGSADKTPPSTGAVTGGS